MTAAADLDVRRLTRAEQVEHLRRKMASVSAKVGSAHRGVSGSDDLISPAGDLLAGPESQDGTAPEQLPRTLPRGTVAVARGARSLTLGMVAR